MWRSIAGPLDNGDSEELQLRRNLKQETLAELLATGEQVWIDLVDPGTQEIDWLAEHGGLHPAVVSDLRRNDRRPTLMVYPDYIFLSLFQPQREREKIVGCEIHCIISDTFFLTVRASAASAVEEAYDRVAKNPDVWDRGLGYFLYLTMQAVIDSFYPVIDRITLRLNKLEETLLLESSRRSDISRQTVYIIKQQLINMRQMVAPQREVISSVIGEERLSQNGESISRFRHLYERLLRVYDVIDSQRDLASNVLDLIRSAESARLSDAVMRLTIISMIFIPLTFVIGLFQFDFITTEPELTIPIPGWTVFLLILGLIATLSLGLSMFFRQRGWL
jgi:magnesium transporter